MYYQNIILLGFLSCSKWPFFHVLVFFDDDCREKKRHAAIIRQFEKLVLFLK